MNLLELTGVLVIIAVLLGTTALRIKSGRENEMITTAQQNISTFKLEVKNLYKGEPDFTGLTTNIAVKNKIVPTSMVKGNGEVRNVWDGEVTVETGTDPSTYIITSNEIPEYACVKLATFESWKSLSVNGVEITQGSGMVAAITGQLQDSNTIAFTSDYSN